MTQGLTDELDLEDRGDFLLSFASLLLRFRWLIAGCATFFATVGLLAGLLSARFYVSTATFIPQTTEGSLSALAAAASQLGVRAPASGGGWVPAVYVQLLHSNALLDPIAHDTLIVAEEANRRVALMDLLKIKGRKQAESEELTVIALRNLVQSAELRSLSAVQLSVRTKWPSVSAAIAKQLVAGVQKFNIESRKSQAMAESQFLEGRTDFAQQSLRDSEDRLASFLRRNRVTNSPELALERDRLQRDVSLRQQLYTSLMQSREEARARAVRDTPVITVIEEPKLPVIPDARRSVLKAALGLLAGGLIGIVLAFLIRGITWAQSSASGQSREFLALLGDVTPHFVRRRLPNWF